MNKIQNYTYSFAVIMPIFCFKYYLIFALKDKHSGRKIIKPIPAFYLFHIPYQKILTGVSMILLIILIQT